MGMAEEGYQRADRPAIRLHHAARRGAQTRPGMEVLPGLAMQVGRSDPQRQEQRGRDRDARDLPRGPGIVVTIPAMPAAARAPGISVEWVSADVPVPAAVRTDVAGFIGIAERGPDHLPVRITSWSQFQAIFGGYDPRGWLAYAVNGFFANGGDACWVVRIVDPATARPATGSLPAAPGGPALAAQAISTGTWAEGTQLTAVDLGGGLFSLVVDAPATREVWPELSLDGTDPRFYGTVINDPVRGSQVLGLSGLADASVSTGTATLAGGAD